MKSWSPCTEDYEFLDLRTGEEILSINPSQLTNRETGESFPLYLARLDAIEQLRGTPKAVEQMLLNSLWHVDLDTPEQWQLGELKLCAALKYGVPIVIPSGPRSPRPQE